MDHVSTALIIMLTAQCNKSLNINVYLSFVIIKTLLDDLII